MKTYYNSIGKKIKEFRLIRYMRDKSDARKIPLSKGISIAYKKDKFIRNEIIYNG